MKRVITFIILILGFFSLSSCKSFRNVNKFYFDTIYHDERITIQMENIKWNPGFSKIGGAEVKTTRTKQEVMQELEKQGITFLNDISIMNSTAFQINNKGLWTLEFKQDDKYTFFLIKEMSIYIKEDIFFPFPLYGIYKEVLLDDIYLNIVYENIDEEYIYHTLQNFNKHTNAYTLLEKYENEIKLIYLHFQLSLTFENQSLKLHYSEI